MDKKEYQLEKRIKSTILYYVRQYKKLFVILFLCIIVTTFSGSAYPYIFGQLIDNVFVLKKFSKLAEIVAIYVLVFVINQCLHFVLNLTWAKLMVKYIYQIREDMFKILQRLPAEELENRKSGDVMQRINWDSEHFLHYVHKNVFYLISAILECAISLGIIFFLSWLTGIWVVIATPAVVYVSRYFSKRVSRYYDEKAKLNGERSAWIFEVLEHIHELKLLQAQDYIAASYAEQNGKAFANKLKIAEKENEADQVNKGILLVSRLVLYGIAVTLIIHDDVTIGSVIAILGYFDVCISRFNNVNKKIVALKENKAGIFRCMEILEKATEEYNEEGLTHVIKNASVSFENVSFSYDNAVILKNLNFEINSNETFGIVGESGCGKSTLASLINNLHRPSQGKILIDGIDVNSYQLHALRNQIGIVYQDSCFFMGSIRFNLIFSEDKSRDDELLDIIEKVGLKSVIEDMPNGLDTIIMDGNVTLSGGQKQRLSIVRAYAKKPRIIIFDEATSALDSKAEGKILKTWTDLFKNSTKIVISHRLSTIINADRIAMLNNGKIEMIGTHSELMSDCKQYRKLFSAQS